MKNQCLPLWIKIRKGQAESSATQQAMKFSSSSSFISVGSSCGIFFLWNQWTVWPCLDVWNCVSLLSYSITITGMAWTFAAWDTQELYPQTRSPVGEQLVSDWCIFHSIASKNISQHNHWRNLICGNVEHECGDAISTVLQQHFCLLQPRV